eukprot:1161270-Pelagomonas_calceolata.AAC.1
MQHQSMSGAVLRHRAYRGEKEGIQFFLVFMQASCVEGGSEPLLADAQASSPNLTIGPKRHSNTAKMATVFIAVGAFIVMPVSKSCTDSMQAGCTDEELPA